MASKKISNKSSQPQPMQSRENRNNILKHLSIFAFYFALVATGLMFFAFVLVLTNFPLIAFAILVSLAVGAGILILITPSEYEFAMFYGFIGGLLVGMYFALIYIASIKSIVK